MSNPQAAMSTSADAASKMARMDETELREDEQAQGLRQGTSAAAALRGAAAVTNTRRKKEGLPELVIEEGAPPIPSGVGTPTSPKLIRMDTPVSGALMNILGGDDGSPNAPADDVPSEGQPMNKIIRSPLAEGDEEAEDSPAVGASAGALSLELPDDEASPAVAGEMDLRAMTPASGVVHNSLSQLSPINGAVGKVHAVAGDLGTP